MRLGQREVWRVLGSRPPTVVRPSGDIDFDTAPALTRALADALRSHHQVVLNPSGGDIHGLRGPEHHRRGPQPG